MKKILLILVLSIVALGCSSDEDADPVVAAPIDFKLVIDGVELEIPREDTPAPGISSGGVSKIGNLLHVSVYNGYASTDAAFNLILIFTAQGKFVSGRMNFSSYNFGNPIYTNFIHFPSNYFQVDTFILDEVNHKVKMNFTGNLYYNNQSLTSEAKNIHAEIDMEYSDNPLGSSPPLAINNVEQYCRANFNANPWEARYEYSYSSFTNEDEYKVEIKFANSPTPGSYAFDPLSTTNYVRLSKFNPVTLVYDYYNTSGEVGYTYREFHGTNRYSFIGTFSFTAVNPTNPTDIIQVTNGEFRSYQQF